MRARSFLFTLTLVALALGQTCSPSATFGSSCCVLAPYLLGSKICTGNSTTGDAVMVNLPQAYPAWSGVAPGPGGSLQITAPIDVSSSNGASPYTFKLSGSFQQNRIRLAPGVSLTTLVANTTIKIVTGATYTDSVWPYTVHLASAPGSFPLPSSWGGCPGLDCATSCVNINTKIGPYAGAPVFFCATKAARSSQAIVALVGHDSQTVYFLALIDLFYGAKVQPFELAMNYIPGRSGAVPLAGSTWYNLSGRFEGQVNPSVANAWQVVLKDFVMEVTASMDQAWAPYRSSLPIRAGPTSAVVAALKY